MARNNEQLRKDLDVLKTDNTQIKAVNDKQNSEIGQLTTLLNNMVANNEKQIDDINFQSSEIEAMKEEITQLIAEANLLKAENMQLKAKNVS